jgi:hypothetical protein
VNYDDETLMAYADGELDASLRAEIAAAIDRDAGLARRVERQRALRIKVADAFAPVLEQPVPERLRAVALAGAKEGAATTEPARGKVLQFPAPAPRTPWRAREWLAMAASVVLGVAISWRVFAPGESNLMAASGGALVARGALASALDQQLASEPGRDGAVLIGLTFKTRDGGYCRNFTVRASRTAGLACRVESEWQIPLAVAAEIPAGGVQQAGGAIPPAILQAIEARIAGEPLDAAGEQNARRSGWDPGRK